jgi:hypothetical protein
VQTVPGGQEIGILDLYESLSQVPKIAAVFEQKNTELKEVHRPDNGFMQASLELKAMEFLLAEMLGVRDELRGNHVGSSKGLDKI